MSTLRLAVLPGVMGCNHGVQAEAYGLIPTTQSCGSKIGETVDGNV